MNTSKTRNRLQKEPVPAGPSTTAKDWKSEEDRIITEDGA